MKLLHTADLHLKEKEHLDTLRVVLKTAVENGCETVLVCGDLFDKDSAARELEPLIAKTLEEYSGRVYILPGNHDADALMGRKGLSSNSTVFSSTETVVRARLDDFELIAIPFREGTSFKDIGPLECDPANSLLMAHGSYYSTDFFYEDSKDYFPMFEEDLRDRFRYAALGHYHKPVRLQLGATTVINPGSPRPTRDSDTGARAVAVIDTSSWKAGLVPLDTPYYEKITVYVNASDTPESIASKINANLPESIRWQWVEKIIVAFAGILPDPIDTVRLGEIAGSVLNKMPGAGKHKVQIEPEAVRFIDNSLLKNPFVRSLLDELEKAENGGSAQKEKARTFALERINALFR